MQKYIVTQKNKQTEFSLNELESGQLKVVIDDKEVVLNAIQVANGHYSVLINNQSYDVFCSSKDQSMMVSVNGDLFTFDLEQSGSQRRANHEVSAGSGAVGPAKIEAIMPGKIVSVKVKVGDVVSEGQGLVVLEAMKMENELPSPKAGKVAEVLVTEGATVENGAVLVVVE